MPKQKTHKGAAKRYKVTGTGKIRHEKNHPVSRLKRQRSPGI